MRVGNTYLNRDFPLSSPRALISANNRSYVDRRQESRIDALLSTICHANYAPQLGSAPAGGIAGVGAAPLEAA